MDADGFVEAQRRLGVCVVHLVSGEDIIGDVFDRTDPTTGGESYVITKPVMPNIAVGQQPDGQPSFRVGLLPLRPYLGNLAEVEIAKAYAMYIAKVNKQMEELYLQFTTGITLASVGDVPSQLLRR